ncbi:MAG: hypothetical protein JO232_14720 [Verrucomicrobia bacterium]|nr:hypothetical protein [Verrucomicrobiota bacterium]
MYASRGCNRRGAIRRFLNWGHGGAKLEQAAQRFEHYELVTGKDGKPVELGRGAMGVTYKAFDVDMSEMLCV